MKIAFFTEGKYYGKVPANHPNMRTDLAWIHLLDADHIHLYDFSDSIRYDLGIIIIPKGRVDIPIVKLQKCCKKLTVMQEGPCNYWTDYTLHDQLQYLEILSQVDFILCHNVSDIQYYKGITGKNTYTMRSVMVEESIKHIQIKTKEKRAGAIIGGNMCSWYNGMVSFMIAKHYSDEVWAPSMGRKVAGEDRLEGLKHLPYLNWSSWIESLNNYQVGVHMMPTVAAGTFSLNCAYLGIPCIGNIKVDTQRILHPNCSFEVDEIYNSIKTLERLKFDEASYKCDSIVCKKLYDQHYHSRHFKQTMLNTFETEGL